MDSNNWRAAQGQMAPGPPQDQVGGGEVSAAPNVAPPAAMDAADWRTQLQADHRQRIVNKIMDTLRRHLPFSGHEGLQELKEIAIRFEEEIYTAATSQSDYLRKISLKMLTLEKQSQNPMASSLQPNAANTGPTPPDQDSLDSTAQTGNVNGGDWQEEVYQKIKSMKDMYFLDLNDMLMKIATKLQQHDSLPPQPRNEPLEKLRYFKLMLERLVLFLWSNKNDIQITHKDNLAAVEKQIVNILNSNRPRRSVSLQQGQPPQPQMRAVE